MSCVKYILSLVILFYGFNGIAQSPWVNNKGSFYGQLSGTFLSYNDVFNSQGEVVTTNLRTTDNTIGFFGEYSVANKTSIIVNLPYKMVQSNSVSLSSLGDSKVKVKHQLLNNIPLALHYGYTAPISTRVGELRTGYNQHAFDLGMSVGYGKSSYYTYGSLGYRYRNNIPNQVIVDAEFGFNTSIAKQSFFIMLHIAGALNTSVTDDIFANETVLYHNNGDYLSPGLKLSYNIIDNFWLNASGFGAFFAKNQGASPTISIGIAYSLKK